MKLALDIKGRTLEVDFRAADGRAEFAHDGRRFEAEVSEPEPGLYVIRIGARIYRCTVDRPAGSAQSGRETRRLGAGRSD